MKALQYIVLCVGVIVSLNLHAQNAIFLTEGKIEFEKRVNLYARLDESDSWSELQKKTMPKFRSTYFDLLFSKNRSVYQPGRENPDNTNTNMFFENSVASENVVYTELDSAKSISQKKAFEEVFLFSDSTRHIDWKITDETRIIAGFQCRRANAIIMDTIYVVAFYTDEILAPGGPESFNGLPGMILGVSLPHQHLTWFATKVSAIDVSAAQLKAPTKGKKVTMKSIQDILKERLKYWGKEKQQNLEALML
ncbi:MAG: GLPGLI family protein [Chitinophagaceae bacterium]